MSNKANIFYDHEIEEISRNGSLGVLPVISYMFESFPEARTEDILYTVSEHVRRLGLESYPTQVVPVPQVSEPESAPVVEEPAEVEIAPVEEYEEIPDTRAEETEAVDNTPKRREIKRRHTEQKIERNLNFRGIMDDLSGLDL